MASIQKHGKRWRAFVARKGIRTSKLFDTKVAAKDWAAREEYLILNGQGEYGPGTVGDLLDRYAREVSPTKRGARWEQIRLELIQRDRLARIGVKNVKPADFADWRDRRLKQVSAASVRREMVLLSAVMSVARKEWGSFPVSPLTDVRKPSSPPHRERRVTDDEIAALVAAGGGLDTLMGRAVHAFRFAVETGMRAGEIVSLTEIDGRVARLTKTKNGDSRDVPLSRQAVALWEELPGFRITSRQLDTSFRRARRAAKIEGLTFHDSRHEAITRLSRKLDVLALARMVGHRDIKQLQVYYQETAEDLAARLD